MFINEIVNTLAIKNNKLTRFLHVIYELSGENELIAWRLLDKFLQGNVVFVPNEDIQLTNDIVQLLRQEFRSVFTPKPNNSQPRLIYVDRNPNIEESLDPIIMCLGHN